MRGSAGRVHLAQLTEARGLEPLHHRPPRRLRLLPLLGRGRRTGGLHLLEGDRGDGGPAENAGGAGAAVHLRRGDADAAVRVEARPLWSL